MGGERDAGDKRDSSPWGCPLSNLAFPPSVGFFRSKQNQMSASVNATTAIPPTTPVKEMEDMRLCSDSPKRPPHHRRLHLCDLQADRQTRRT